MIVGGFDGSRRPFVECRVVIPRLGIEGKSLFLDTGADGTCLHPDDSKRLEIPLDALGNRRLSRGIGGRSAYFRETALLVFADERLSRAYRVELLIAEPNPNAEGLPSLLGRNVINHWFMEYDPVNGRLDFTVRYADYTLDAT